MSLSERLRPDVECAPWVIDEVKTLEEERDQAKADLSIASDLYTEDAKALRKRVEELEGRNKEVAFKVGDLLLASGEEDTSGYCLSQECGGCNEIDLPCDEWFVVAEKLIKTTKAQRDKYREALSMAFQILEKVRRQRNEPGEVKGVMDIILEVTENERAALKGETHD